MEGILKMPSICGIHPQLLKLIQQFFKFLLIYSTFGIGNKKALLGKISKRAFYFLLLKRVRVYSKIFA